MMVLSVIKRMNEESVSPDLNTLLERVRVFESHLDYILTNLVEKGYVDKISNSEFYDTYDYKITDKGRKHLEQYMIQAKHFVSSLTQLFQNREREELSELLAGKKDLLWFACYEGLLMKKELQDIADFLDLSLQRLWWDESFQKWLDRHWDAVAPF